MGCNLGELGYMKPRRGILEQDEVLAKDRVGTTSVRVELFVDDPDRVAVAIISR